METKYDLLLNFRNLADEVMTGQEFEKVLKLFTAQKWEMRTRPGPADKETEVIFPGWAASQIVKLIDMFETTDLGSYRIEGRSQHRQIDTHMGVMVDNDEGVFKRKHTVDTWGKELDPLPVQRERDEKRAQYFLTLSLKNLRGEPLSAESWRTCWVKSVASKLNSSFEPEFAPGRQLELIYRNLHSEHIETLIGIVTDLPDMGTFVLIAASNRRRVSAKTHGGIILTPETALYTLFGVNPKTLKAMETQMNAKDERSKSDTIAPMR